MYNSVNKGRRMFAGYWQATEMWARAAGFEWDELTFYAAAAKGRLTVLKWLWENGCPAQPDTVCHAAAENGHLQVLKWAHKEVGFQLTTQGVIAAAEQGHWKIMQWALENGVQWDPRIKDAAAKQMKLGKGELIIWILDHGQVPML